ncbi:MAG TPA: aldehyde ferredoxin oxidoreductase C-terminal domain-containing protein [Chloroflexota bacterium]|nr:aldehyde ferredoxin oxidoreductase C-terminal domain-containing protein [Chloroflexota bacterium]
MTHGYHRRVLHVDLGERRSWTEEPEMTWYRRYGGGGAWGAYFLLRDMDPTVDAFDPGNVLVFASSVVAGAPVPGVSRHSVIARSPLTGGIGESQSSGPFGAALKGSGVDALVVRRAATEPVYLLVSDGAVEIRDASGLWGMETGPASDRIESEVGRLVNVAAIGPAGELRVRFASIVNDSRFVNQRCGLGAVMGSKNLKAVAGDAPPTVAAPDLMREVIQDYEAHQFDIPIMELQNRLGLGIWQDPDFPIPFSTRNFQQGVFDGLAGIAVQKISDEYLVDAGGCHACPTDCMRRLAVPDGANATEARYGNLDHNSCSSFGQMVGCGDPEALLKANELVNRYGMDPESCGHTIAWAMECYERGLIDEVVTGGVELRFGDAAAMVRMVEQIGRREGFGDVLAEGSERAAARIGRGTSEFVMCVKGKEIPAHEPRNKPGLALIYATGPIGPDFGGVEHDPDFDPEVGVPYALDKGGAFGLLEWLPETEMSARKVRQTVVLKRWWSGGLESLLFCLYATAPVRYMPPAMMAQAVGAATGWDFSLWEFMQIGERRLNMFRVLNHRAGLTAADDVLPDRFFDEPIAGGPYGGVRLDRGEFAEARRLYYEMVGWDAEGRPTAAKLHELELGWLIEE